MISNIWKHPKTTFIGLLTSVVQVAAALTVAGVGPAKYMMGVSAVATALLGLVAKDPNTSTVPTAGSTAKLGCWALIALLTIGTLPVMGCKGVTVAQDIVNWTPALQSAVATVDSTGALLAPQDAPIFAAATVSFDAASDLLVAQAKAYLANPNAGTLAQLQTQIVTFQQTVNAALLTAAKITNPNSQQHALNAINAVATIVTAILALVTSISSKAQVAAMADRAPIKLAAVEPYVDYWQAERIVDAHYKMGDSFPGAQDAVVYGQTQLEMAGF